MNIIGLKKNKNLCLIFNQDTGEFTVIHEYIQTIGGTSHKREHRFTTSNPREAYIQYSSGVQMRDLREFEAWMQANGYDPLSGQAVTGEHKDRKNSYERTK